MTAARSTFDLAGRLASGDTSPEVLQWVREGFARHLKGRPLDQALGLDRTARKREAYRLLAEVAQILGADDCGAWECARRVEEAIKHFEARVLPRLRLGPIQTTGPVNELLAKLYRVSARFPREQRQIYEVVLKKD